jgi:hypothetical protein
MKKSKLKSLVKLAKKTAQADIQTTLTTQIKAATTSLGEPSKKLDKQIAKSAKQLAKILVKEVKIDKDALQTNNDSKPVKEPKGDKSTAKAVKEEAVAGVS